MSILTTYFDIVDANTIPRIALVGGPKAGKTTLKKALEERFGDRVLFIDEAATLIFSSGITKPPTDPQHMESWLKTLQPAILATILLRECDAMRNALPHATRVIVCDRGTADIAAYLPGGKEATEKLLGVTMAKLYSAYDIVIHLESTATAAPEIFNNEGNVTRYESLEEARSLEMRTRAAWEEHPNYHFISGVGGIETVIKKALAVIEPYLSQEFERTWKLPSVPPWIDVRVGARIEQAYLIQDGEEEVRIRKQEGEHTLCYKRGSGSQRYEEEISISKEHFDALSKSIPHFEERKLVKTRYTFDQQGQRYVLDIHANGLIILEAEFSTARSCREFTLPADLFEGACEVTEERVYSSASLFFSGFPQ